MRLTSSSGPSGPSSSSGSASGPLAPVHPAGTVWSAWHLHLASVARSLHDRVITEVIGPTVGLVGHRPWFFIRYWQAGPHLRLRVGDVDPVEFDRIEGCLADRLAVAGRLADGEVAVDPASYQLSAGGLAGAEEGVEQGVAELLPPGVVRRPYHPEVERYGGPALMPRTERLFGWSSRFVVDFLAGGPTLRSRAITATRGTIAAAAALGGAAEQAGYYAHGLAAARSWAVRLGYSADQLDRLCGAAGGTAQQRVAPGAAPAVAPSEHGVLDEWHRAIADVVGAVWERTGSHPGPIVFSHVHMLHNRLGLTLVDELRTYARLARVFRADSADTTDSTERVPVGGGQPGERA